MKTAIFLSVAAVLACACADDDGAADANSPVTDATSVDALNVDSGADAPGMTDTGLTDAGLTDTGLTDTGSTDAGNDGGVPDADDGPDSGPGDTYETFGMAFMTAYCIECHGAGNARRDYTTLDDIRRDMNGIRCGVSAVSLEGCGSFPPPRQFPVGSGPRPEDDERARLVAWVEAGLP